MKCLYVQVKYTLKSGCRDDFYQRFRDNNIREMSSTEPGNIEFEIYMPHDRGNEICIFEKWETLEDQEKHTQTLHYAILCELKAMYAKKVEEKKYWLTDFEDAETEDVALR